MHSIDQVISVDLLNSFLPEVWYSLVLGTGKRYRKEKTICQYSQIFGNVMAMEYQSGSWYLLCATKQGRKKSIVRKMVVCMMAAMIMSVLPMICRFVNISSVYPLHELTAAITDIPCYQEFPLAIPVWFFVLLLFLTQMASMIAVVIVVLLISYWRKNYIQTMFFAILILVVPIVLKLLGFEFAGWGSVYPLYSWTALR